MGSKDDTLESTKTEQRVLLTRKQLAAALGICRMTVSRMTVDGKIPFVPIGKRQKRYFLDAVVAALSNLNKPSEKN
jgi:excisionase family DNA binding protein